MVKVSRDVSTDVGTKDAPNVIEDSYILDTPENAGDVLSLFAKGEETVQVTVNKQALLAVCNLAKELYETQSDTAFRNAMRRDFFGKKAGRKTRLASLGL